MKSIITSFLFFLLGLAIFSISCQKELSCENCATGIAKKPPVAIAGPDQIIDLPKDSLSLDGSASYDPDGTIVSHKWTKISGPLSANIVHADSSKTLVKSLLAGAYQYELTVKDKDGLSAKDTMMVVVNDPAVNQAPIANAGTDQTILLPIDSVWLKGNLSVDPDGTITSYQWTKISGPGSFNMIHPTSVQTKVDQLLQGIYQFELKVTDNAGLFSKDTVQISVVSSQPPPTNCDVSDRTIGNANLNFFSQLPEPRYGITVATIGNKIFIAGGFTRRSASQPPDFSSRVDIYDVSTGQWTITQLSEPRTIGAVATLGNKIFFAGGSNATGLRTTVDIYDVSANTWSITQLSQARAGIAGGAINSKVFFAGGTIEVPLGGIFSTQQLSDIVDVYDVATNSRATASLSEGRYCINDLEKITVTVVGNKIFFSGGSCNTTQDCSSNRIDMYDAVTNTWSYENYKAQNGGSLFSGISVSNKNYRVTGEYWAGGNIVEIRDEVTHTTSYECLSGTLFRPPVSQGNKIIFPVSTFQQGTGYYELTHFDVYDLSTGTWSINKLPPPDIDRPLSLISVNNEVYVIDGYFPGGEFLYEMVKKLEF